jgi:hypothetical protein
MKTFRSIFILLAVTIASVAYSQAFTVTIDKITANSAITGSVQGLASKDASNYKVIVYVHTDQWYIHPYAGQDEGKSWASVKADGTWQISTVRREFRADRIAALLVPRNFPEPNKVESLENIPYLAITNKDIRGTADYGKL